MFALSFEERGHKRITDAVRYNLNLLGEECIIDAGGALGHERAVIRISCFKKFEYVMTFIYRFTVREYEDRQFLERILSRSLRGAFPWYLADELERNSFLC